MDAGTGASVGSRHAAGGVRRSGTAGRFPHTSARAAAAAEALREARVLVADETQRLPVPCLESVQSLWDHPGTQVTLVLCGAGSERALGPASAAGIQGGRVAGGSAPGRSGSRYGGDRLSSAVATVPAAQLAWIDRSCAHGTFRTSAALTAHLQNALLTTADTSVDRALLRRLFKRVAPPL
ncbi:hypothetical protein [Streptomyces sp. SLBN-31]|uniref:hypothetical protein n=1 Tax=Streptomyces sp. SLBN-31 TaxID=2768444 RepID=UPI0021B16DAE|nr:hypothetical protein [Streptomyces sp. SLBN-31]